MPDRADAINEAMKRAFYAGLWVLSAFLAVCSGASTVTLTVENKPGFSIPPDFAGLSFGAVAELKGHGNIAGYLFSPTNFEVIQLFKNAGLHNLRLGGSTVEGTNAAVPDHEAIDNVFGFAKGAGIKVIYSLRLLNGDADTAAATAKYIWDHYSAQLKYFAIGNEPDIKRYHYPPVGTGSDPAIKDYATYLATWRKFAAAVTNAVPDAKFAGPDAASEVWAGRFARDEKDSGIVALITQHNYVGGSPYLDKKHPPTIAPETAISNMLSEKWVKKNYPDFYKKAIDPIRRTGLPFRMTEANDYLKGVGRASDAYASALFSLDYLHWFAARGCMGVDFHNTEWLKTDTLRPDGTGGFQVTPKAYGIKMFELGGRGNVLPVEISNPDDLNLTAYAVGDADNLYVTVINKEYGPAARNSSIGIVAPFAKSTVPGIMLLTAPQGDLMATNSLTLGGSPLLNNAPWQGKWTALKPAENGTWTVTLPAASAAVIRL